MAGALLALMSAVVWGTGDFAGGLATRRGGQFQVLTLAALSGVVLLVVFALLLREPLPDAATLAWAAGAGISGAVGLSCLYRGLAGGSAATVAPLAGVITAAAPVVFTALTSGLPKASPLAGFALAMAGIWLVAHASSHQRATRGDLELAVAAGLGFGGFLILIAQVPSDRVFMPLAVTRLMLLGVALAMLASRGQRFPPLRSAPLAWVAGACDAGGNVLYLFARESTRLDVAAVLSSLYPATTVFLAFVVLKERITPLQWLGTLVCLASVVLIVM
jgi:uncharacterized membrane protein